MFVCLLSVTRLRYIFRYFRRREVDFKKKSTGPTVTKFFMILTGCIHWFGCFFYLLSELTTSFTIGMYVMVPFLLIDLMVATLLMSMGMAMVPPTVVALPLKVAVFVLADGWTLVVRGLIASFGV